MKKILVKIRDFGAKRKIFLMRATGYMGIGNSIMIILVLLKIDGNPTLNKWVIPIIIGWLSLLIFIGWLEVEIFKVPHKEASIHLRYNPPQNFVYTKIGEIDKRTKEMEIKLNKFVEERKHGT